MILCTDYYLPISNIFRHLYPDTQILGRNKRIFIKNPAVMLKLLRNFGHLVENLGIDFVEMDSTICDEIEKYLSLYCSDSLERLFFKCRDWSVCFEDLQKPLKKLKALQINTHSDGERNRVQFMNARNLPNLEHLFIYFVNVFAQREKIYHENITDLTIVLPYGTNPFPFPFSIKNVKHLLLNAAIESVEVNDAFCELINNAKHLKTLTLNLNNSFWSSDPLDKLLDIQNIVLNVEELQFKITFEVCRKMSFETISRFLKQSRNIRKIKFLVNCDTYAIDVWFQKSLLTLNDDWKSYTIDTRDGMGPCRFYVIERKTN